MAENGVFSCVPFCLRSLGRFERCGITYCSLLGILGGYLIVVTLVAFDVQIKRKTLTHFAVDNQACDLERKKNTRFLQSQGRGIKGRTI